MADRYRLALPDFDLGDLGAMRDRIASDFMKARPFGLSVLDLPPPIVTTERDEEAGVIRVKATWDPPTIAPWRARKPEPLSLRESEARIIGKPGPVRFHGDGAVIIDGRRVACAEPAN